ncbi:sugar transferase [Marinoscillum furvescens]|nr:sugar transferase [Marinoscillum furvescens]
MKASATYRKFWKPASDRVMALVMLILAGPVMLLLAVVLKLLGHPVIFKHVRPGLNARPFTLYKFTSMRSGEIFPFGRFLRRTSLDELPQLFNILKGEMSFVGPRPLLMEYLAVYNETQQKRHLQKPGVTGWAQVNGRNECTFEEKLAFDVYYVEHCSFRFDFLILCKTVSQIFKWRESDFHAIHTKVPHTLES